MRFCRCFFYADRPRTARDHMPARQFDEFMVGVVIHVTGWSAWCATVRRTMARGSKCASPVRGAGMFSGCSPFLLANLGQCSRLPLTASVRAGAHNGLQ